MPSVPNPYSFDPSDKRLSFVYNSEITGFQPLDFGKLNNVEDILIDFSGNGINVHQDDLTSITDSVSVSGELYQIISGFNQFGVNVHQDNLTSTEDSVSVSGQLYEIVKNAFPQYNSIELYYNGNNNTGVYYKQNGNLIRLTEIMYDGSNNVTGVFTTNY